MLPTPYQKMEALLLPIWILNWLWVYGAPTHKEEDHLRQPSGCFFSPWECPSVSVCVYSVCAFCPLIQIVLCFLGWNRHSTYPLGLGLNHFKDLP